ncbi:hypothetical protein [Aureimonas ureilytica]|uniref:hypothetical protein n=1 Tax=Aureimonas ureilytica TaxID=401562 RepID=UPI000366B6F3|nr:hypothetical protein [Aureimonas ureilytica]
MGIVTEPGFHGGRFRQGGQFAETEAEPASTEILDLDGLTRDELVALAKARDIQHPANATKAEIAAALTASS